MRSSKLTRTRDDSIPPQYNNETSGELLKEILNQTTGMMEIVDPTKITIRDKTEAGTKQFCGDIRASRPAPELLYLLLLSQSLPVLLFGVVFAVPALKQLHSSLAKLSSKVGATSSASSSAPDN
jgi:hypothetical protein